MGNSPGVDIDDYDRTLLMEDFETLTPLELQKVAILSRVSNSFDRHGRTVMKTREMILEELSIHNMPMADVQKLAMRNDIEVSMMHDGVMVGKTISELIDDLYDLPRFAQLPVHKSAITKLATTVKGATATAVERGQERRQKRRERRRQRRERERQKEGGY